MNVPYSFSVRYSKDSMYGQVPLENSGERYPVQVQYSAQSWHRVVIFVLAYPRTGKALTWPGAQLRRCQTAKLPLAENSDFGAGSIDIQLM